MPGPGEPINRDGNKAIILFAFVLLGVVLLNGVDAVYHHTHPALTFQCLRGSEND